MTSDRSFKRRVRERMAKTGESYTAARSQLARKRGEQQGEQQGEQHGEQQHEQRDEERARVAAAPAAPAGLPAVEKVVAATGRTWDAWFATLDRWGARERTHREMAAYLVSEHAVAGWWAQSITMWYERARGLRLKHQQADGFTINVSRTIAAPLGALFDAFVKPRTRARWLADGTMSVRGSRPGVDARFDWGDGATRVVVSFVEKGPAKATVTLSHERLPDAAAAERAKAAWKARLGGLKALLEQASPGA